MKTKDYDSIKWSDHFYLDEKSPSGLSRKIAPSNNAAFAVGSFAGTQRKKKNGVVVNWKITLNGNQYVAHRIVWILAYGYLDKFKVVDHLNGDASDNTLTNLCLKTVQGNNQNMCKRTDNTSGVKGVYITSNTSRNGLPCYYWTANWIGDSGKKTSEHFSIAKLGHDQAKALAVACRTEQITLLNAAGASYTERHIGLTPATPPVPSSVQQT